MKRLKVFEGASPGDVINIYCEANPFIQSRASEQEIKQRATNITAVLNKHFGKTHEITEIIESENFKPPFAMSWKVQEKNAK